MVIKLLIFDVDGCLSDGKITYTTYQDEILEGKNFNVKDGLAISSWNKIAGKKSAIITGRNSPIVAKRAEDLGISYLYQGIKDKKTILEQIMHQEALSYQEVAILGDDLNDYGMLTSGAHTFCPQDASSQIKKVVDYVLQTKGGEGAAREMIEQILEGDEVAQAAYLAQHC